MMSVDTTAESTTDSRGTASAENVTDVFVLTLRDCVRHAALTVLSKENLSEELIAELPYMIANEFERIIDGT